MDEILLVAGMSGAGRSTVSAALEDVGWSVIDNLPVELIPRVSELAASGSPEMVGVAFVVGRSGKVDATACLAAVTEVQQMGFKARIVFVDAPDDVLVRRFEGNRRRHPFQGKSLEESIAIERQALSAVRDAAEVVIDTGTLNTNQLRQRIGDVFHDTKRGSTMRVSLQSFGYSNGLPRDVDVVFDCRFLPNPHWVEALRPHSGLDEAVATYVLGNDDAKRFVAEVVELLTWQIPAFAKEGKAYLSIAIGCTGGRHRSVALVEEVARELPFLTTTFHRDVDR
jgi:UPF0042 nucleotide-binding protein